MLMEVRDPDVSSELIEDRRARGLDRWDEVWNGVYIIITQPTDEHQDLVGGLTAVLYDLVQRTRRGKVRPGVNVSDRRHDWKENYRCPDVVVYLQTNPAENRGAFWYGGPDLAVEIVSPGDRTRDKLEFYAAVETRELLIVDRDPWGLELYRLVDGELQLTGRSTPDAPEALHCESVSLTFRLVAAPERPGIHVVQPASGAEWTI